MCLSGTAKTVLFIQFVISVFVSYTYVYYVFVYFVLYVHNCMHKRTIKYLVSCILYRVKPYPNAFHAVWGLVTDGLIKLHEIKKICTILNNQAPE